MSFQLDLISFNFNDKCFFRLFTFFLLFFVLLFFVCLQLAVKLVKRQVYLLEDPLQKRKVMLYFFLVQQNICPMPVFFLFVLVLHLRRKNIYTNVDVRRIIRIIISKFRLTRFRVNQRCACVLGLGVLYIYLKGCS